jgi:MFS family permease
LVGSASVALFLGETWSRGSIPEDDEEENVTALAAAFRDRRLAALLLPIAVLEIAASWVEAVTPLYANNAGTLTPSGVGLLFTYAASLSVIFQLPLVQASARLSGFAIVLASGIAQALGFACLLASPSLPFLVGAVTLLAFSEMLFGPLTQTIVTELAPRNARATYMAAFAVVGDLKDAAGPAIGTYLYAAAAGLPWLVGMPVALAAALGLALAARQHETSRRPTPPRATPPALGRAIP